MKNNDIIIRREQETDYRETENLVREAFWNVYHPGCTEHFVLHEMRNNPDFVPELDFIMLLNGKEIGQVVYARSEVKLSDGGILPVMTFGPIGILPEFKRKGYGKTLLDYSMQKAAEAGAGALFITGNIDFYGKSGFVPAKTKGIVYADDPSADYFLVKELKKGFLSGKTGVYADPDLYFVADKNPEAFEAFDRTFPEKQKQKLPGQLF